ncbi:sugar ABC transporter permease [Bacillus altitudinis MN12]|uniref:Permease for unsaturated rhamnogalacturonan n=2 Tax=Bacillus TaxID=1386 RepID=A0A5K1N3K7_BACAB|nr:MULTISPECIES: sugar ABC transporter permease [Bacillus]AHL72514.1 protein lplB [Bacillus pumilus]KML04294.1 protein lplB [Bacillus stratosphericus]KQL40719.1 protein lplB [Bacillus sp. FJAT-21955]MBA8918348.1 putative aldouronate transport system permease protein [Bacillus aerius]MBR0582442.1 sugar ABC transporter permease [Bacillus altitudinis MN12]MBR0593380.1 sugar ABC transporter permease [Bacillus altitudinis C16B11]MBR0627304.1 sugar ABC transporter permease [Bacillus altitudinis S7
MKTQDVTAKGVPAAALKKEKRKRLLNQLLSQKFLYLMILPGLLYFLVFKYVPMWGLIIAFQDYQPFLGILGSEWVGFKHFIRLFTEPTFFILLKNTLILFAMNVVIFFPIPILLALLLNEVRLALFKKFVQTMIYIPHFMSWVIVVSLSFVLLTVDGGLINELIAFFGGEKINFLLSQEWFRPMYILQVIWREAGWSTIIYLAAITAVDPQLYEAAKMDGAGRLRQMWHITLPAIKSVIVVLLILKIGDTLELGFEHVYLLLNATNREVAEIFDTYVYTAGLKQGQFSYSTAVGLFKAAVGLILVMMANRLAKKFGEEGIY